MNGPKDYHTKWSESQKVQYSMISVICEIYNMTPMNTSIRQKQTHRHREQTCDCPEVGGWGGIDWEFGVS